MTFMTRSFFKMVLNGGLVMGCALLLIACESGGLRRDQADWNQTGIWRQVNSGSGAVSYVPQDLPSTMALSEANGEWVVDPQDGHRFFVPRQGTAKYTLGVLRAEAQKATNHATWERKNDRELTQSPFPLIGPYTAEDQMKAARKAQLEKEKIPAAHQPGRYQHLRPAG
jgi:hypothetical protein